MTNRTVTGTCPFVLFLVLALSFPAQAGLISESSAKPGNPSSVNSPETGLTGKSDADIVEELKGISDSFPTFDNAKRVVEIAEHFDRIAIQEPLFKAAGMAFASLGRMKPYRRFRNRIGLLPDFETGVIATCRKCNGSGTSNGTGSTLCEVCNGSGLVATDRETAKSRAREWLDRGIRQIEWRIERDRKEKEEDERRAEEKRRAEEFAAEQRAKGLVLFRGRWMTPAQRDEAAKYEKFRSFIIQRSKRDASYEVFQIVGDGKALCSNLQTGEIFCLMFSTDSANNRAVVSGKTYRNDLFWGGVYSYTTVENVPQRVSLYFIDYDRAVATALQQGFLDN